MKPTLLLLFSIVSLSTALAQGNQWTWMSGDIIVNQLGVYGTKGVPSPASKPGARTDAVRWTDLSGNLWLFGGGFSLPPGFPVILSDLWKYVPSTGQWTWMSGDSTGNQPGVYGTKGVPSPANKPGARTGAVSWTDPSGNLWLFGGENIGAYGSNDLWKYVPSTGQWTWMSGDSTYSQPDIYGAKGVPSPAVRPGARIWAMSWSDASGNLWLFGGRGFTATATSAGISYSHNTLWKYVPSTGQWTWISGDSTAYRPSVYGTKGIPSSANKPGSRCNAVSWTDPSGSLWLFGGSSIDVFNSGTYSDLWKYVPSTGQWTWISGDSTANQPSVYGIKGVPSSTNKPGQRSSAVSWIDAAGNLWLFGGYGYGRLNDMWRYAPASGQWTWMSGDDIVGQLGIYGTKGVPSPANKPGARTGAVSWTDISGNLWLFGGDGYSASGYAYLNDLWKYTVPGSSTSSATQQTGRFAVVENPVNNSLRVSIQLPVEQPLILQLRNMNGHLLKSEVRLANPGGSVFSMQVDHLERGVYLISIASQSLNSTKIFIKL